MIVQLTGTLIELMPTYAVLDVNGIGYELGLSTITSQSLPPQGTSGVTLFVRMVVREDAVELFGFGSREERALFDQLRAISGVGPKLALATLSTFTPAQLATVVLAKDITRLATVPGVGQKKASRLLVELSDVFNKNADLRGLVGISEPAAAASPAKERPAESEALEALLSMGFTSQEASLALEGAEDAGAATVEAMLAYALRRIGGSK